MIWGVGVVALLGLVAWVFRTPGSAALGRAFGVLAGYGLLFWLTLLKVWWTAGLPAVEVDDEAISYQPLHTFKPKRMPWDRVLASAPKIGTHSLRLVVLKPRGGARELFLNLGVIRGQHRLLDQLDEQLADHGLLAIPGCEHAWRRPEWVETELSMTDAADR